MDYSLLKTVHVAAVATSYTFFLVRGVWMIAGSPLLAQRWVRVTPHVVDTVLLASAIWMTFLIRQNPFAVNWLTAKIFGLVLYVVLGTIALKRGRTRSLRIGAWIVAQAVFAYIVAVAITKNPLPWT